MKKKLIIVPLILMMMVLGCADSGTSTSSTDNTAEDNTQKWKATTDNQAEIYFLQQDNKLMRDCIFNLVEVIHAHSHGHSHEFLRRQIIPNERNNYQGGTEISGIQSNSTPYSVSGDKLTGCGGYTKRIDDRSVIA